MTNYELIKTMCIEEMAEFMTKHHSDYCPELSQYCGECVHGWHDRPDGACEECAKQWLESEAEEE